jgi:hypothetical protein
MIYDALLQAAQVQRAYPDNLDTFEQNGAVELGVSFMLCRPKLKEIFLADFHTLRALVHNRKNTQTCVGELTGIQQDFAVDASFAPMRKGAVRWSSTPSGFNAVPAYPRHHGPILWDRGRHNCTCRLAGGEQIWSEPPALLLPTLLSKASTIN